MKTFGQLIESLRSSDQRYSIENQKPKVWSKDGGSSYTFGKQINSWVVKDNLTGKVVAGGHDAGHNQRSGSAHMPSKRHAEAYIAGRTGEQLSFRGSPTLVADLKQWHFEGRMDAEDETNSAKPVSTTEQFAIDEADHYLDYDKWGIVDDKYRIISGNHHPTATTHKELGGPSYSVEFAQDREGGFLSVRTRGKKSLKIAAKTFASLPHMRSGMVTHTHFSPTGMDEQSGKSHEILARIKKMVGES